MTTDFAKLIAEIDEADAALKIALDEVEERNIELRQALQKRDVAAAKSAALHRALVLVGGAMPVREGDTLTVTGTASADSRPPREICAADILAAYPTDIPLDWSACNAALQEKWNARTGRSALTLARQMREKAVASSAQATEAPPADGLELPPSLDRSKRAHA
jgi:hypothetical protein